MRLFMPKMGLRPTRASLLVLVLALQVLTKAPSKTQVIGGPNLHVDTLIVIPGGVTEQNAFTWGSHILLTGDHWLANATYTVHLEGPLNAIGIPKEDRILRNLIGTNTFTITTNSQGGMAGNFEIPYDNAETGFLGTHLPNIPIPGRYRIYITRPNPLTIFDFGVAGFFNLHPETRPTRVNWAHERGGRDGQLVDKSPERTDPEWVSVWSQKPIALYATVADTDNRGGNQPAFISHEDFPGGHYAHDLNLDLVPDQEYRWVMATANMVGDPQFKGTSRIELEWETLNNGNPNVGSYGFGSIGCPLFVTPTNGDRVYVVGRWIMDNGHPDVGDRSEIHPPRMIATMRKRNHATPFGSTTALTRAGQVDIYISGHGGGVNRFYDGMESMLENGGRGGGRMEDWMNPGNLPYDTYFHIGPANSTLADLLTNLLGGNADLIWSIAGPSAFTPGAGHQVDTLGKHWLQGAENRPINDMDYDFDAPLPKPPIGATHPVVKVSGQFQHTTKVVETITYFKNDPATGLPTMAHIHIPCKGGDNRIYAKTLLFSWDKFSPPGKHYKVDMNNLTFFLNTWMSGRAYCWVDICGQYLFLTGLNQDAFLHASTVLSAYVNGRHPLDVFLDDTDTIRIYAFGYDQEPLDGLFGWEVGRPAYEVGIDIAKTVAAAEVSSLGASDAENVDLGGALFAQPASQPSLFVGDHVRTSSNGYFFQQFDISYIGTPPSLSVFGAPADFGGVPIGNRSTQVISVVNRGEQGLVVSGATVTGAGYSIIPGLPIPFTVAGGAVISLNVTFAPTAPGQGAGTLTIRTNDPFNPVQTFALTATTLFPQIKIRGVTSSIPTIVSGSSFSWPFSIVNAGTSLLVINKIAIAGAGYTVSPKVGPIGVVLIPAGSSVHANVTFTDPPRALGPKFAGNLTIHSNSAANGNLIIPFGAEVVPVGIRLLVLNSDGLPFSNIDEIKIDCADSKPTVHLDLMNKPLVTIDPPLSFHRIQYQLQTVLPPTTSGGVAGTVYTMTVKVGALSKTITFTLDAGEFKPIKMTLP